MGEYDFIFRFPFFFFLFFLTPFFPFSIVPPPWMVFENIQFCGVNLDSNTNSLPPASGSADFSSLNQADLPLADMDNTFNFPNNVLNGQLSLLTRPSYMDDSCQEISSCGISNLCDLTSNLLSNCVYHQACTIELSLSNTVLRNVIFGLNCEELIVYGTLDGCTLEGVIFQATERVDLSGLIFTGDTSASNDFTIKTTPRRPDFNGNIFPAVDLSNIVISTPSSYEITIDAQMNPYSDITISHPDPDAVFGFVRIDNWRVTFSESVTFILDIYGRTKVANGNQIGGIVLFNDFQTQQTLRLSGKIGGEVIAGGGTAMTGYGLRFYDVDCGTWEVDLVVEVDINLSTGIIEGICFDLRRLNVFDTIQGTLRVGGEIYGDDAAIGARFDGWPGPLSTPGEFEVRATSGILEGDICQGVWMDLPFDTQFSKLELESAMNMAGVQCHGVFLSQSSSFSFFPSPFPFFCSLLILDLPLIFSFFLP